MKKLSAAVLFLLGTAVLLSAELHVYQVPDLAGGNGSPSIARNSRGDILIVYRNNVAGAAYYCRKHDGGTLGPAIIPGQPYEPYAMSSILFFDIVVTPDDNFHVVWNFNIHNGAWGLYYAVFNVGSERWSDPAKIVPGKVEGPKMTLNPVTEDLVLVYDSYQRNVNKDVFIKIKTSQGWQKEVNLSGDTQTPTQGTDFLTVGMPAAETSSRMRILAPHGQLAETNAWVAVDETDGYVYVTWKADKWNDANQIWELMIVVALLDPSYHRIWYSLATADYDGFHFLPTIAAKGGRAMMAFAWKPEAAYHYLTLVRDGNSLIYDAGNLLEQRIAECPVRPHYEFFSALLLHGDRLAFTYKDVDMVVKMYHYSLDGTRLDAAPIDLGNGEPSLWPYDSWSDPEVGLLTAWATRDDDSSIRYSLYDEPLYYVRSPLNLKVETRLERSFFSGYYINFLTWENNPDNAAHSITISAQRIYRKPQGQDISQYVRIAEVSGTTLDYTDSDNVSGADAYDYAVTCVDSAGHESVIQ